MDYIKKFGFGEKTGINLSGEEDGILFSVDRMGPVETATTAFGQGVSVTPMQQVMGISAAVNGGYLYTPYIVSSIKTSETNETILSNSPILKRQVISEETSNMVRFALESVVAEGTGRNAFLNGYRVGGKTGTAQKVKDGKYMDGNYILSFIGFVPANDPEVTIYVAIDNPKGVTQYGGTVSAPIAASVLSEVVNILNIPKSEDGIERKYEIWDTVYIKVPDVMGMDKVSARKTLSSEFKIEYSGTGDKVISQSPKSGEYVKRGDTIRLMLNN